MVRDTSIEWTDDTWNPCDGCKVCSPGCANCYAMRVAGRFSRIAGHRYQGLVTVGKNKRAIWNGVARLDLKALVKPLSWRKPRKVFVNSMSDLFYEGFTNEEIAAVFAVMAACPHITFQVLTKRAARMRQWFAWIEHAAKNCNAGRGMTPAGRCLVAAQQALVDGYAGERVLVGTSPMTWPGRVDAVLHAPWPLPNVWLGVSTENQDVADERIPELLVTPAAIRFLSCEPLLGELGLFAFLKGALRNEALGKLGGSPATPGLDWVIVGCESGPGARACATSWLTSLRDQCASANVAFFLKQAHPWTWVNGARPPGHDDDGDGVISAGPGSHRKAGGVIGAPYLLGDDDVPRQHLAFPEAEA